MTLEELQKQRRARWRVAGDAVRSFETAVEWLNDVGFCVMYPEPRKPAGEAPAPAFIAAWLGRSDHLPGVRSAFAHPEAAEAEKMAFRLARQRAAYEWPLGESTLLISPEAFPFFYALAADREGKQQPSWATGQRLSKLARDAWSECARAVEPVSDEQLRRQLGAGVTVSALRRALRELWQRLRIIRVDRTEEGDWWQALSRRSPEILKDAQGLSIASALSALVSKFIDAMIAATQSEIETFFSPLVARSKVRDALNALLAAREISTARVGSQTMLEITPARAPRLPPNRERGK